MAFTHLSLSPSRFAFGVTALAGSPIFAAQSNIGRRVLMPIRAMSFSALPSPVCLAAKGKASFVNLLLGIKELLGLPTEVKPAAQRLKWNPGPSGPLRNSKAFTIVADSSVRPPIELLLTLCGPTAILGAIAKFIIYPIKRLSWRTLTHIRQKSPVVIPSFANGYSPPPVVLKEFMARIRAALTHVMPCCVTSTFRQPMRSVGFVHDMRSFGRKPLMQTPTRLGFASAQMIFSNLFDRAAYALADKIFLSRALRDNFPIIHGASPSLASWHRMGR